MVGSHSFRWADLQTSWYGHWAKELLQDSAHLEGHALFANKFWQNAVMAQVLDERGALVPGAKAVGFGVGRERLPALFAKHGVYVTATDQDFTTQKAGHWIERELAQNEQSLNRLGICNPAQFAKHVSYLAVDMTRISRKLFGKYNFLWSNCALGHLGSIPAGLMFIEQSLQCLIPGGWAVHTTEVNVLSNKETVTDGNTVIFRLRDIYQLQKRLTQKGYEVSPFLLTLGDQPEDKRISLAPQFGNDFTKIHFRGHVATQVVLIIHKPKNFQEASKPKLVKQGLHRQISLYTAYRRNILTQNHYRRADELLSSLLRSKSTATEAINVSPVRVHLHTKIPVNASRMIRLPYQNRANIPLLGVYTELTAKPLVLATANPNDRQSKFIDESWAAPNRPAARLWQRSTQGEYEPADYILPGYDFAFEIVLNGKGYEKGKYREDFSIVQEHVGWVPNTSIRIDVEVV